MLKTILGSLLYIQSQLCAEIIMGISSIYIYFATYSTVNDIYNNMSISNNGFHHPAHMQYDVCLSWDVCMYFVGGLNLSSTV